MYVLTTLGIGGAEKQVIGLAQRMAASGHTVALLVLKHADCEEWPVKLPVMRLNMTKSVSGIGNGLRFAAKFLSVFRPDIVHSHTFPANVFGRMLRFYGVKCLLVNTIHNVYEGQWHRMQVYRLTDRMADRVTAVSTSVYDRFVHERAVTRSKFSVITNGIDTIEFSPDTGLRKRARRDRAPKATFVWLAIGRLAPAKDYPNLLRAFARVRSVFPEAKLWIAGEGDFRALELSGEVRKTYEDGAVEFLGLRRDIRELLSAADGFVLSSAWEGMPIALGEAMAMEKVVVATDVGGVREMMGEAGLLAPARNSDALAEAMLETMARDAKSNAEMGRAARARIVLLFSMTAKAVEWERSYLQWLCEKTV